MPAYMTAQKRQDIREAIQAGMTSADIQQLLQASAGTIVNIKRELGIPIRLMRQTRTKGPVQSVARVAAQVVPEANITELAHNAWGSSRAEVPTAPPAPTASPLPAEYVAAFEARVLEFHQLLKEKDTALEHLEWLHEQELRARDATIERLERENAKLLDEYSQIVFQQQNWQGPTSIMNQSLGNGG